MRALGFAITLASVTLSSPVLAGMDPAMPPAHLAAERVIIAREWRGLAKREMADEYARYLQEEGVQALAKIPGNLGVQMFRRDLPDGVEFVVISYWPSIEAIKAYTGEEYQKAHHLPKDADYLVELPREVYHYQVLIDARPAKN